MVKYYKKVTIYKPWTQPLATDYSTPVEGGNMVISAESEGSGAYSYNAVNPMRHVQPPTSPSQCTLASSWKGSGVYWWQVKFPYKLKITAIDLYNAYQSYTNFKEVRLYTDNTKSTQIGVVTNGTTTAYEKKVVQNIPEEGIITDTVYLLFMSKHATSPYNDIGFGGITIYATKVDVEWQSCTKEEYDQLPDSDRKIVTDIYSIFSVNKFYELVEVEKDYIQPTANYGLTGKLAISGGNIQNPYGNILQNNPLNQSSVHNAFNGGSSNLEQYTGGNNPMFQWVCAIGEDVLPILSHITFTTNFNGYVMGSNDRANWVTIPNTNFSSGYHDIVLNTQYKYYCIQATSANGGNATSSGRHYYATLTNVRLYGTVTKQAWVECTKEEYNQLPEDSRYKVNRNLEFSHKGDYIKTGLTTTNTVQKHYLGGSNQSLRKKTIVRDIDLDFTKCTCSTNSTYGLSTTSHQLVVLFMQAFNPNYFLVDNINAQLVQLHLRINASHVGGGDSICNHSLRLFYVDGTTKDFTSTNNGACMNSGSTEFIIPEQSKPFNKFQYFANEYYNSGYNIGCNAYLTFISAKEKRVAYVQS